jgi:hypothetical protein
MTTKTVKTVKIIKPTFDAWAYGPKLTPAEKKATKLYLVKQAARIKDFEEIEAKSLADEAEVTEAFKVECIKTRIQELEVELKELRAQLPSDPKVATYKRPVNLGVGAFITQHILDGLGNKEILAIVENHYGNKNTTYACVAWYRNKLNQG